MNSEVHNGDCVQVMRGMRDKQFTLILTDPPYNVGLNYKGYDDQRADYKAWCDEWFAEAERIADCVLLTPGMVNFLDWITERKRPMTIIPWMKPNQCSSSTLRGFNVWEPVLVYGKPKYQVPQDGIIESIGQQADAAFHACPKQLKTWQKLLGWFARPGDTVFDPFLGSGTTRIAAYNLGIDFVGCELSGHYFQEQEKRFAAHSAQNSLFAASEPVVSEQENLFI